MFIKGLALRRNHINFTNVTRILQQKHSLETIIELTLERNHINGASVTRILNGNHSLYITKSKGLVAVTVIVRLLPSVGSLMNCKFPFHFKKPYCSNCNHMNSPQCVFSHELNDYLSMQNPYCSDYNCKASLQCVLTDIL